MPLKAGLNSIPEPLSESAQISILTNDPSKQAIYSLFGHTVIRVQDKEKGIDLAFNYGVFDFNSPNFAWRFMTGKTDYTLEAYDTRFYIEEYSRRQVGVTEQILNLTQQEKNNIWEALLINLKPENKIYRYNFLYDNCATRPRDIIEQNINGTIEYTPTNTSQTYRDLIHECVGIEPWARFGIDLIIGADADKTITDRQKDFLPRYLKDAYHGAIIKMSDKTERPLLEKEYMLLNSHIDSNSLSMPNNYPMIVGILFLCLTLLVTYLTYKKEKVGIYKIYSTIVFLFGGFLGGIIFFLMFISVHPCVGNNWNLVWLNPLLFIAGCLFFVKPLTKYIYYYHFINFVTLLLFLLVWFLIPQQFDKANIPYILSILLISGTFIFITKKQRNRKNFHFK